jgi:dTDP-4-dehydrorhamnose reductase
MRAIIIGHGTLGSELARETRAAGWEPSVYRGREDLDITDAQAVESVIRRFSPIARGHGGGIVFNTAAYTNVDGAESATSEAYRCNALGAENVAVACARWGVRLVHYSTDAVYPDAKGPTEVDLASVLPPSFYGQSKLVGEGLVREALPDALVLRVANLYGRGGKNWPSRLRERLMKEERVEADVRREVAPTWAGWVAEVSVALVVMGRGGIEGPPLAGIHHVCAAGSTLWREFASAMNLALPRPSRCSCVTGLVRSKEVVRIARLGPHGYLGSALLPLRGIAIPTWQELLSRYLESERNP